MLRERVQDMEWDQLQSRITTCHACKLCGGELVLIENMDAKNGWCSMVGLYCTSSLCTASKDCQYVRTSLIQGKCADVNICVCWQ